MRQQKIFQGLDFVDLIPLSANVHPKHFRGGAKPLKIHIEGRIGYTSGGGKGYLVVNGQTRK
jgi:hypothetical protein